MKTKKSILVSVILLLSIAANAQKANSHSQNFSPFVSIIPFQLVNNLIVVQASIDGKRGNFIIDTGSEFMVLNAKYFSGHRNLDGHIRGFSGSGAAFRERMIWFSWGKHDEKMYRVIITPFGALERILGIPVMGYIGFEQLKNFEVVFDYREKEITLIKLDRKGRRKTRLPIHIHATDIIPLRSNGHMPYLIVEIGTQKLKLGIDSGAALNLLRSSVVDKINPHFRAAGLQRTASFNGKVVLSKTGWLRGFTLGELQWPPMKCVAGDMRHLNRTLRTKLDGVLGFDFLKEYKVAVNYRKGRVCVWRRAVLLTDVEGSGAGSSQRDR